MIAELRIENFRCLQDFRLILNDANPHLLIGKNGAGKSSIRSVFEILRQVCRGGRPLGDIITDSDLSFGSGNTVQIGTVLQLGEIRLSYLLRARLYDGIWEVEREVFTEDQQPLLHRHRNIVLPGTQTEIWGTSEEEKKHELDIGDEYPALPMLGLIRSVMIGRFRHFFQASWILAPEPSNIIDVVSTRRDSLAVDCHNICNVVFWAQNLDSEILDRIGLQLRSRMPDLEELEFRDIGGSRSQLFLRFSRDTAYETPLSRLSDGQKCFFIAAVLSVFAEKKLVPFCFWDEPDNFLSLSEVQQFIRQLRRLKHGMTVILASHHPETIRCFPADSVLVLERNFQTENTTVRPAIKFDRSFDDLADAVAHGELGF